ncbi:hypothetical protein [Rhodoluna limnophila]|uniref:hypothetical protein n=1 Tax=Rhodoluna limnophila TaxID=232537 RepID=UPI001107259C|nr:hypothetical protein [Rhodoluna limnophila]
MQNQDGLQDSDSPYEYEKVEPTEKRKSFVSGAAVSAGAAFALFMMAPAFAGDGVLPITEQNSLNQSSPATSTDTSGSAVDAGATGSAAQTLEIGLNSFEASSTATAAAVSSAVELIDPLAVDFGNTSSATPSAGAYGDDDDDDDDYEDSDDDEGDEDEADDDDEDED